MKQVVNNIIDEINQIVGGLEIKCLIVHADLMHAIPFDADTKESLLQKHICFLSNTFQCPIWMSSFSYSVPQTHLYDVKSTPSELGVLNEYFRKNIAQWRSYDPIFSYSGIGVRPIQSFSDTIHPYGENSIFRLMNTDGFYLLQYGCRMGTQKKVLYNIVEAMSDVPYKQKVFFETNICDENGNNQTCKSYYYVHPWYRQSDKYRNNIFEELVGLKMAHPIKDEHALIDFISIKDAIGYLQDNVNRDPYYLLTSEYATWLQTQKY